MKDFKIPEVLQNIELNEVTFLFGIHRNLEDKLTKEDHQDENNN